MECLECFVVLTALLLNHQLDWWLSNSMLVLNGGCECKIIESNDCMFSQLQQLQPFASLFRTALELDFGSVALPIHLRVCFFYIYNSSLPICTELGQKYLLAFLSLILFNLQSHRGLNST